MATIIRRVEGTTHATAGLSQGMDRHPVKIAWIAVALASLLAAGCAGTRQREGEPSDRERYWHYAKEEVPNFSSLGRISGWRPLGRDELVVWTRFDEAYILRVAPSCFELDTAVGIRLESRVSGTISSGFDWVRVGRDRCRIVKIFPVDYKLMKQEERELRQESKQDAT